MRSDWAARLRPTLCYRPADGAPRTRRRGGRGLPSAREHESRIPVRRRRRLHRRATRPQRRERPRARDERGRTANRRSHRTRLARTDGARRGRLPRRNPAREARGSGVRRPRSGARCACDGEASVPRSDGRRRLRDRDVRAARDRGRLGARNHVRGVAPHLPARRRPRGHDGRVARRPRRGSRVVLATRARADGRAPRVRARARDAACAADVASTLPARRPRGRRVPLLALRPRRSARRPRQATRARARRLVRPPRGDRDGRRDDVPRRARRRSPSLDRRTPRRGRRRVAPRLGGAGGRRLDARVSSPRADRSCRGAPSRPRRRVRAGGDSVASARRGGSRLREPRGRRPRCVREPSARARRGALAHRSRPLVGCVPRAKRRIVSRSSTPASSPTRAGSRSSISPG